MPDPRHAFITRPLSEILAELEKMIPQPMTQHNTRVLAITKELTVHLVRLDNSVKSLKGASHD